MFEIYKICGVAILGVTISIILKNTGSTIGPYITQITAILIVITSVLSISPLIGYIKSLITQTKIKSDIIYITLTASVIALVCRTVADICKENGEQMLKSSVEFAGNAQIMLLCLPLIKDLMDNVMGILKI